MDQQFNAGKKRLRPMPDQAMGCPIDKFTGPGHMIVFAAWARGGVFVASSSSTSFGGVHFLA